MAHVLLISVRLHEGRYHGVGDEPPAPARLFQALVAAAGLSGPITPGDSASLEWLERLDPPVIATPRMWSGQAVSNFVPNNDLDAVDGDHRRIGSVRTLKLVKPKLFDPAIPLLFGWSFISDPKSDGFAGTVCGLAERLYQFGRGVDFAWGWGDVIEQEVFESVLMEYPGIVYRACIGGGGNEIACPEKGTLLSLQQRYEQGSRRFQAIGKGRAVRYQFTQPSKPRFRHVAYESPTARYLYELQPRDGESPLVTWPLHHSPKLVVALRDGAAGRLRAAMPHRISEIERSLIGRKADGRDDGPASARVRIVPLASIGHFHADGGIRRVLVEVPSTCPLDGKDVAWAFSALAPVNSDTGDPLNLIVASSTDESMLKHYGVDGRVSRIWRSVTAVALPELARRRRIDPAHIGTEAKDGAERSTEQVRAAASVAQAVRQAEVPARVETIRVQREPFEARGERAESFASGTRFAKERLWHVEIRFDRPVGGPLVIGDGRFVGLGIMAPDQRIREKTEADFDWSVRAFGIDTVLGATNEPTGVARAMRRAVMARVQAELGPRASLPTYFCGHEPDGSVAKSERSSHLTFVCDVDGRRLLVIAPHVLDRRSPTPEEVRHLTTLQSALQDFRELRAGSAGCLGLSDAFVDPAVDSLFAPCRIWESVTAYQITRHGRKTTASELLASDIKTECRRRGLPDPDVIPLNPRGVSGLGVIGGARLIFKVAVKGPIVLGRSRHFGGGLFVGREGHVL